MTRLGNECALAAARRVLDTVGHLLRPEEQREFFGMMHESVTACLVRRDELRRAERRLGPGGPGGGDAVGEAGGRAGRGE